MKIKDIPKIDQPREKMMRYGPEKLSDAELLAIVIGQGKKGENAIQLGKKLLKFTQGKTLANLHYSDLKHCSGIGISKACQIVACFELGKRFLQDKKAAFIMSPKQVWEELRDVKGAKKEYFYAFYLDIRNKVIKKDLISIGTLNASLVHPREVFEPAVRNLAAQVILSIIHPANPSLPTKILN